MHDESEPTSLSSVTCPYCGETVEIFIEEDVLGEMVYDCEVCCNPWRADGRARRRRSGRVEAQRSDD